MKATKKLLALLLALTMVFGLATTAFATTNSGNSTATPNGKIYIENPAEDQSYKGYRLLDLVSWEATDDTDQPQDPTDPAQAPDDEIPAGKDQNAHYTYKIRDDGLWRDFFIAGQNFDWTKPVDASTNKNEAPAAPYVAFEAGPDGAIYVNWIGDTTAATGKVFSELAMAYLEGKNTDKLPDSDDPNTANDIPYDAYLNTEKNPGTNVPMFAKDSTTSTDLKLGYYLVDTTLGSLCALGTTDDSAYIREKQTPPAPDKEVKKANGDWAYENNSEIGKEVEYRITIPCSKGGQYVVHDKMTSGLSITDKNKIQVYKISRTNATDDPNFDKAEDALDAAIAKGQANDSLITETTDYTLTFPGATHYYGTKDEVTYEDKMGNFLPDIDAGEEYSEVTCSFCMSFTEGFQDNLTDNDEIVIIYKAIVTDDAIIGTDPDNDNDMVVKYGDDNYTAVKHTDTDTYSLNLHKFYKNDDKVVNLSGAHFALYREVKKDTATERQYLEVVQRTNTDTGNPNWQVGVYHPAKDVPLSSWTAVENSDGFYTNDGLNTEGQKYVMISDKDTGFVKLEGLEEGTYFLEETRAPNGFNQLVGPIKVVIKHSEGGDANVETDDDFTVTYYMMQPNGTYDKNGDGDVTEADGIVATDKTVNDTPVDLENNIPIENKYGPEMPVTGGMGTTLFYVFGGLLTAAAVVLLITKKRVNG